MSLYDSKAGNLKLVGIGLSCISRAKGEPRLELSSASFDFMTSFYTSSSRLFTCRSCIRSELVESNDSVSGSHGVCSTPRYGYLSGVSVDCPVSVSPAWGANDATAACGMAMTVGVGRIASSTTRVCRFRSPFVEADPCSPSSLVVPFAIDLFPLLISPSLFHGNVEPTANVGAIFHQICCSSTQRTSSSVALLSSQQPLVADRSARVAEAVCPTPLLLPLPAALSCCCHSHFYRCCHPPLRPLPSTCLLSPPTRALAVGQSLDLQGAAIHTKWSQPMFHCFPFATNRCSRTRRWWHSKRRSRPTSLASSRIINTDFSSFNSGSLDVVHCVSPTSAPLFSVAICYSLEISQKRISLFVLSSGVLHLVGVNLTGRLLSSTAVDSASSYCRLIPPSPAMVASSSGAHRRCPYYFSAILNRGRGALPCQTTTNPPSSSPESISCNPHPHPLPLPHLSLPPLLSCSCAVVPCFLPLP
ncbi:hypothetical protein BHM03_00028682 [Ensete ventricosum]|nr:hypothetical protein BHM03_00028682 [Ensete ventricosum]